MEDQKGNMLQKFATQKKMKQEMSNIATLFPQTFKFSPARITLLVFLTAVLVTTFLLSLPIAAQNKEITPLHEALFTATSAVSVTGLTTVSTAEHWSLFGQIVILVGIKVGGLGIITLASFLGLTVSRRLGLRNKLLAAKATNADTLNEVAYLLKTVILTSFIIETFLAIILTLQFLVLGESVFTATYHGIFYAISAFNNAGFTPHSDGLVPYENNFFVIMPIALGVFIGSLGFPVLLVLLRSGLHAKNWNLHTKLTILVSILLTFFGTIVLGLMEWNNPKTLGKLNITDTIQHTIFTGIMPRSGGFSIIEISDMEQSSLLVTDMLMFIGGGSASTAGGIKVTTLAILFLAALAEIRGDRDVQIFRRRIPTGALRIAISVTLLGATVVTFMCITLLSITNISLDKILFEVISAFGTAGLSVEVSSQIPPLGIYLLTITMLIGRIGTITLAAALTLRECKQTFRYPEERPIIG